MSTPPRRAFRGLVLVNIVLVFVLAIFTVGPGASASGLGAGASSAGDYIMVGGEINGSPTNAVYLLDQRAGVRLTMTYNRSSKQLDLVSWRNVAGDLDRAGGGR